MVLMLRMHCIIGWNENSCVLFVVLRDAPGSVSSQLSLKGKFCVINAITQYIALWRARHLDEYTRLYFERVIQ